jgi:uncharacterized protein involved in exopolysaccharide biosynthesis
MDITDQETRKAAASEDKEVISRGVIDLRVLFAIARSEAATVLTILAIFLILSILYLHLADQKYAVRMVITPVAAHSQKSGENLEELSSLAGIDLGGGSTSQFKLFVGALRSPFAAQSIADDQDLLKAMFPRDWSAAEGRWREHPSHLLPIVHWVEAALGWHVVPWSPPGVSRVFDFLQGELRVTPDPKSGVVALEIDSRVPNVAERILVTLNNVVDERIRQRDLARSTADISYLSQRLSEVTVEEYRRALVANLVDQEKTRMLASAPLSYVSDVLGKPMISSKPVSPLPVAVFVAAIILGGLIGLGVASIRYRRRR